MTRRPTSLLVFALLLGLVVPAGVRAAEPGTSENFQLVGHDPLFNRGMNAAPAIFDHYVYVGSRTDGSHPNAGVLVVDVADPSNPTVVGQIGPPNEGNVSETSRELRVWPQEGLLMVLNFQCSAILHACASPADLFGSSVRNIKFYDVAADPVNPPLVSTYVPSRTPHEFHLWLDPSDAERALLWMSTPTSSNDPDRPNLIITDISGARDGQFEEIAAINPNTEYTEEDRENRDVRLHSMSVTADGARTYLAYLGGGMLVLDSSEVAAGIPDPELTLLTPPANSPTWENMTVHSAVRFPGRDLVMTTDEVYGDLLDPLVQPQNDFGCPWGWVHLIDVSDEANPRLVGEYKVLPENDPAFCETPEGRDPTNTFFTSYAAHNPTLVRNIGFVTWHSGGFQAFRVSRGGKVAEQAGFFSPEPLPFVFTEDPALSLGRNKVVMWSFPIIKDGLIYVVDLRNGLYILRYTGPGAKQVSRISFLEGNSNVGDALAQESGG